MFSNSTLSSNEIKKLQSIKIKSESVKYDANKDTIGEGGFCIVYRAQNEKKKFVAVKRLKSDVTHVSGFYKDYIKREAKCARKLLHPNIAAFLGIIWEPNFHAIVLEYYKNGDLLNFMRNNYLHPLLKAKLLWDVSKGIYYLHWLPKQIIHNDIKIGNVLISDEVTAKLADFGMAYWQSFTSEVFSTQQHAKSPQGFTVTHKSPERWLNINERTTKCDVYSYGILIWETYSESIPFLSCTNEEIKLAVTEGQRPDESLLTEKNPPLRMVDIMRRCWKQRPSERPEMKEVIEELEKLSIADTKFKSVIDNSIAKIVKSSANKRDKDVKISAAKICTVNDDGIKTETDIFEDVVVSSKENYILYI